MERIKGEKEVVEVITPKEENNRVEKVFVAAGQRPPKQKVLPNATELKKDTNSQISIKPVLSQDPQQ